MKIRTLTLSGLALTAIALAVPQDILLRRTHQPDSKDQYSLEMTSKNTMDLPGMGEQDMEMRATMDLSILTGKVDNGKASVEIKSTNMKFDFGGIGAMAQGMMGEMPKEITMTAKMDDRNRVTEMKMGGADAKMQMMMSSNMQSMGQFIEFPDKAVKMGDTWEVVTPRNEVTGFVESKLKATLVGEKEGGYALSMVGVVPVKVDLLELAKKHPEAVEGMPVTDVLVTGSMDIKMEGLVDKSTGRTIRLTTRIKQKTTTNIRQMGMTSDSSGETVIKMTLKP